MPSRTVPLIDILARKGVADRFWSKVHIRAATDCWEWQGAKRRKGQTKAGKFKAASYLTVSASRSAYTLATGQDPGELWVLHHCDNPLCCNPSHLYLGTHEDNVADAITRKRFRGCSRPGAKSPMAKLTEEQVASIRGMLRDGATAVAVGKLFGVSTATISNIKRNASWKI